MKLEDFWNGGVGDSTPEEQVCRALEIINALEARIAELEAQVAARDAEIERTGKALSDWRFMHAQVCEDLDKAKATIPSLRASLSDAERVIEAAFGALYAWELYKSPGYDSAFYVEEARRQTAEARRLRAELVGGREVMHEGDKDALRKMREDREVQKAAAQALDGYINRLRYALRPFALICADDGDNYNSLPDNVIIRTEVTAGELREAREALGEWLLRSIAEDEANDPNL